jgi:NAD-specific glutamate dehydrogenase
LVGAGQEGTGALSVGALHDALKTYIQALPKLLSPEECQAMAETTEDLAQWQLAGDARALAGVLPQLGGFLSVHRLTQGDGLPLAEAHQLVHEVNQRLGLTRLSNALGYAQFSDQWQKQLGDRQRCIVDLAREDKLDDVLHHRRGGTPPTAWVDAYLETRAVAWKRYQDTLQAMFSAEGVSLVAMAVAVGQLETL